MTMMTEFDQHDIEQFVRSWDAAFHSGDYEAMADMYEQDAMLVASGTCTVFGRPAITQFWRHACAGAQQLGLRRTVHADQYDNCGDLAYLQGTVSLTSGLDGRTVVWFVTLWKRHADRSWRILADTSTVVARGVEASRVLEPARHV